MTIVTLACYSIAVFAMGGIAGGGIVLLWVTRDEKEKAPISEPGSIYKWADIPFYGELPDAPGINERVEGFISEQRRLGWRLLVASPGRRWLFERRFQP
jgi:hypothetical protein